MPSAESVALEDARVAAGSRRARVRSPWELLADGVDTVSRWAADAAAVCLLLMVVVLCVEIVARAFSVESPFSTWEYAGYLQGWLVLLGASYALRTGGHIRVNLLMARLGHNAARVLDILCCVVGLAVMTVICWALADLLWTSLTTGRRSYFLTATPLWIPQLVLVVGSLLLALQFAARALRGALGLAVERGEDGMNEFGAE
jgi:TRAP-type C4-dicarboxylate transport system permease small subunit